MQEESGCSHCPLCGSQFEASYPEIVSADAYEPMSNWTDEEIDVYLTKYGSGMHD